jgi:hypothetical protein
MGRLESCAEAITQLKVVNAEVNMLFLPWKRALHHL